MIKSDFARTRRLRRWEYRELIRSTASLRMGRGMQRPIAAADWCDRRRERGPNCCRGCGAHSQPIATSASAASRICSNFAHRPASAKRAFTAAEVLTCSAHHHNNSSTSERRNAWPRALPKAERSNGSAFCCRVCMSCARRSSENCASTDSALGANSLCTGTGNFLWLTSNFGRNHENSILWALWIGKPVEHIPHFPASSSKDRGCGLTLSPAKPRRETNPAFSGRPRDPTRVRPSLSLRATALNVVRECSWRWRDNHFRNFDIYQRGSAETDILFPKRRWLRIS